MRLPTDLIIGLVIISIIGQFGFGLAGAYGPSYLLTAVACMWSIYGLATIKP